MRRLAYIVTNNVTEELVAHIYFEERTQQYSAELISKTDRTYIFGIEALGIIIPNPKHDVIIRFLKDRVVPQYRYGLSETLDKAGVANYNWKELIKLNKGINNEDRYRVEEYCI